MKTSVFAVLACILMTGLMTGSAMSAPRAQGPRTAAGDCRTLSQTYGADRLYWGRFSGGRQRPLWDQLEYRTVEVCFTAAAACQSWLYELKSEFNEMPRWNECRRGYRPGAPVPPWWAPKR